MWIVLSLISMAGYLISELSGKDFLLNKNNENRTVEILIIRFIVLAIVGLIVWVFNLSESGLDPITLMKTNPATLISAVFSVLYIVSFILSENKIPVAIASPFNNTSGIIVFIILFVIFIITGADVGFDLSHIGLKNIAIVLMLVSICIVILDEKRTTREDEKEYKTFFLGFVYALLSSLFDAFDSIALALLVAFSVVGEYDMLMVYGAISIVFAIILYIYYFVKNGKPCNLLDFKKEKNAYVSSIGETIGDIFYILAVGLQPLFSPLIICSYCAFVPIFSNILLKEKISTTKYVAVGILIISIILFSVAEL